MISTLFSKIGISIATGLVAVAGFLGYAPQTELPALAGQYQTPDARALFETSLASRITSTDTTFTLTSATDKDGNTLASSTYGFIIDEGTATEEMILADCTSTACTNATRGLSVRTGTTTVSTLKFEHRRGASVKITDAPSLVFAVNVFKGRQNLENKLRYDTTQTFTDGKELISKDYADALAFGAIPEASLTAGGFAELATQLETASSTADGSDAVLVIPASNATSTYNSATAPLRVVVTQNSGKIDNNFIATSTLLSNISLTSVSNLTITGTSNVASTTVYATTTSGTWIRPSNLRYVIVEVVGGGGGGGGGDNSGTDDVAGGGGGGGGYSRKVIPVAALGATETVTIGAGGTVSAGADGGNGGTTSFGSHLQATGGTGGGGGGGNANGGPGGVGSGGDLNIVGQGGGAAGGIDLPGGLGGSSVLGGGGRTETGNPGTAGGNYGGGGGGGAGIGLGGDVAGGAGAPGVVVITNVFY